MSLVQVAQGVGNVGDMTLAHRVGGWSNHVFQLAADEFLNLRAHNLTDHKTQQTRAIVIVIEIHLPYGRYG